MLCYHFLKNRVRQFRRRANFPASPLLLKIQFFNQNMLNTKKRNNAKFFALIRSTNFCLTQFLIKCVFFSFTFASYSIWKDISFMWKMTFEIFIKFLRFETPWVRKKSFLRKCLPVCFCLCCLSSPIPINFFSVSLNKAVNIFLALRSYKQKHLTIFLFCNIIKYYMDSQSILKVTNLALHCQKVIASRLAFHLYGNKLVVWDFIKLTLQANLCYLL